MNRIFQLFLILFFSGGVFLFFFSCANNDKQGERNSSDSFFSKIGRKIEIVKKYSSINTTAIQIIKEYSENEVAADLKFKGKRISISGTIGNLSRDILNNVYICLKGRDKDFRSVQCYIADAELVSRLKKGETVTVVGTCEGMMMNILIKNCDLVHDKK
ncbi:MAG: hypothetical protein ACEPOW_06540 [Bacteroidales bacterium]